MYRTECILYTSVQTMYTDTKEQYSNIYISLNYTILHIYIAYT